VHAGASNESCCCFFLEQVGELRTPKTTKPDTHDHNKPTQTNNQQFSDTNIETTTVVAVLAFSVTPIPIPIPIPFKEFVLLMQTIYLTTSLRLLNILVVSDHWPWVCIYHYYRKANLRRLARPLSDDECWCLKIYVSDVARSSDG
jgi:hypothetical protein